MLEVPAWLQLHEQVQCKSPNSNQTQYPQKGGEGDALGLELQVVVTFLTWVQDLRIGSCEKAVCFVTLLVISPAVFYENCIKIQSFLHFKKLVNIIVHDTLFYRDISHTSI